MNLSGDFVPVFGYHVKQMGLTHIESGLIKGRSYAFRYRAMNLYGWSEYSPVSYLQVST